MKRSDDGGRNKAGGKDEEHKDDEQKGQPNKPDARTMLSANLTNKPPGPSPNILMAARKLSVTPTTTHPTSAHSRTSETNASTQSHAEQVHNYVLNKIELFKKTTKNVKKNNVLASFIPDFVLKEDAERSVPYQDSTDAVVFMVDVSGFTALTEAYSMKGKGGTDKLTKTLMGYIGPLAETILLCDGDIVKYAGDAFLAFWKANPSEYKEEVQRAVDCALYIQEKYGSYLCKDVDITIRVKIGIGAGKIHLCGIGNDNFQHYVCFGPGVEAASDAEKHCSSGEVVLHSAAWAYCNPAHYKAVVRDESFRVVSSILQYLNSDKKSRPQRNVGGGDIQWYIRPLVSSMAETKPEEFLRRFIIPPVLRKVDDDVPLDYLNESRLVCICFIHVDTVPMSHEGIEFRETMIKIVNRCFNQIYVGVTRLQGALTKVIMFDKGLTYLVVFGLPGYINEQQCAHALRFSHAARRNLLAISGVEEVSIGVTTGSCYTGVLGHSRRQEYTVMGRKVNKAARLMCYYPGMVSCDQETAFHSKFSQNNFQLKEKKELKGIANPGKIFEFLNSEIQEDNSVSVFLYPMVGREAEFRIFKELLTKAFRDLQEHNRLAGMVKGTTMAKDSISTKGVGMMLFEGDTGIGKSRVVAACMAEAENQNALVFSVGMNLMMTSQTLFGLSSLVMDAIGIAGFRTAQEREEFLRKKIMEGDLAAELCVINQLLHTNFPITSKYSTEPNAIVIYGPHVVSALLKLFYPDDLLIFAVDDAHYLDLPSWEFLIQLSRSTHLFCLFAIRRTAAGTPRLPDIVTGLIYHNKTIKVSRLTGMDPGELTTVACQIMGACGIPQDLERILIAKSQGNPSWIEQVLNELLRTGVLRYQNYPKRAPMAYAEKAMLQKLSVSKRRGTQKMWTDDEYFNPSKSGMSLDSSSEAAGGAAEESSVDATKRMLVVKSGTNIGNIHLHGTIHEILLDAYDELGSNEQIIIKCASVLGRRFSRLMLTRIIPFFDMNVRKFEGGVNHLMETGYFRCASGTSQRPKEQGGIPECFCKEVLNLEAYQWLDPATTAEAPKYQSCKFMEFHKETLCEVVYNLMTEDQRKDFHLKAGRYLESSGIKCETCGGMNSSFQYGVVIKSNDRGALDAEEALKAAMGNRRKSESVKTMNVSADMGPGNRRGKRRPSFQTQIAGMKKRFHNDGSKIAQIEVEILTLLRRIDSRKRKGKTCCGKTRGPTEEERLLNEELHLLRDENDDAIAHLKSSDGASKSDPSSSPEEGGGDALSTQQQSDQMMMRTAAEEDNIDLRLCECSALEAKVAIELVKHYRAAQKYGKCMYNLLDAAEAVITIGNGPQGLIHLDDATALLDGLKAGKYLAPDSNDEDDQVLDEDEISSRMEYLNGLAYYETGIYTKSRFYFINSLRRLGLNLKIDRKANLKKKALLWRAQYNLYISRHCPCGDYSQDPYLNNGEEADWVKRLRVLSYLHSIYKSEKKLDSALIVTIWEVIISERHGEIMHDMIPAYCNMMSIYTTMGKHKDAQFYEKLSLDIIRKAFGTNEKLDPAGLLTTANLFNAVSYNRLCRGDLNDSAEAAYLGLRIAQTIHDNSLTVRLLPSLCMSLLMGLRIPELIEGLQRLWYIAEADDDWSALAIYYAICLDLLLRTAYPLETFAVCENFVIHNDWDPDSNLNRDADILYTLESSLALWYARYSQWDQATKWMTNAEAHKPRLTSFLSVAAELKLLEAQLLFLNNYIECRRYHHYNKAKDFAKLLLGQAHKSVKITPALYARFHHLSAYYYKLRRRRKPAEAHMDQAEKLAKASDNLLELEWILHNRRVWADKAIPSVKFFWLEHTETHVLDWHNAMKVPWMNVMYSLPVAP